MAEDEGADRTEDPTPRRREQAAEEGKVARSPELGVAASFLIAALLVKMAGGSVGAAMRDLVAGALSSAGTTELSAGDAVQVLRFAAVKFATAGGAMLLATFATAFAAAAVQAGGTFSVEALEPKWERLDVVGNLKRLVSPAQAVETTKAVVKVVLVGTVVWHLLAGHLPASGALSQAGPAALAPFLRDMVGRLLTSIGLAYLAVALADVFWQRYQLEKSLRMTKDEVKREAKEDQGDPMIRSARRRIAREMAFGQMMSDVPKASVVITNPTHIAVAIRYDEGDSPVPTVLAIGRDKVAERIKQIAAEAGVPIVENKPVARALFKAAKVGSVIPVDLYLAVAEILAYVLRTRQSRGRWTGSARG